MRLFAMWLLDLNDFAERFLCYSTNLGVWCERSPVPSIPDVFEYAKFSPIKVMLFLHPCYAIFVPVVVIQLCSMMAH